MCVTHGFHDMGKYREYMRRSLGTGQKVQVGWTEAFRNVVVRKHMTHPFQLEQNGVTHPYMRAANHITNPPIRYDIFGCIIRKKKSHFVDEIVLLFTFYVLDNTKLCKNTIVFHCPCNFKS